MPVKKFLTSVVVCLGISISIHGAALPEGEQKYDQSADVGPHHRKVTREVEAFDSQGQPFKTNQVITVLETGLNYFENGQWIEAKEDIEIENGQAVAKRGQHRVIWKPNINTPGAIELTMADGRKLSSSILGLSYFDSSTGQSALIAEIKDSIGELIAPNQILFRDCFDDIKADVKFIYTRGGFEQDVILLETIPSPQEWGLNPEHSRLEVLTEFHAAPEPKKKAHVIKRKEQNRNQFTEPDLVDESLDFGPMKMVPGKAFGIKDGQPEEDKHSPDALKVAKRWMKMDQRTFLVEQVEFAEVKARLDKLPKKEKKEKEGKDKKQASTGRKFPKTRVAKANTDSIQVASSSYQQTGLVLDYIILNHAMNFTFLPQTYQVTGDINLSGTTRFYKSTASIQQGKAIYLDGPLVRVSTNAWLTVGPSDWYPLNQYFAKVALFFQYVDGSMELNNLRIQRAEQGVRFTHIPQSGYTYTLSNVRFESCDTGVFAEHANVVLTNVLMCTVNTPYSGAGSYNISPVEIRTDCTANSGGSTSIGSAVENSSLSWSAWNSGSSSGIWSGIYQYEGFDLFHDSDAATSNSDLANGNSAFLQTTVTGPGILRFNWKIYSDPTYHILRFAINGSRQTAIVGRMLDWKSEEFHLPTGTHTLQWEYKKEYGASYNSVDGAWLDKVYFTGPTAKTPKLDPPGEAYANATAVTLTSETLAASIYYTTNGSDPTTNSTLYSGPFMVNSSSIIKAKAFATNMNASPMAVAYYNIGAAQTVATPTITPIGGNFNRPVSVTLSNFTSGASIYYTTNGNHPINTSTLYTGPITLTTNAIIKAKAVKSAMQDSEVAMASFLVNIGSLSEGLDNFDLSFTTGGDNVWYQRIWGNGTDDAISSYVGSLQHTYIKTMVSGPGVLSFKWRTDSDDTYDSVILFVDGIQVGQIFSDAGLRQDSLVIPSGVHEIKWQYVENVSATQGQGILDAVQFTPAVNLVSAPKFNPALPELCLPQTVTLSTDTAGASIYYTPDGSLPTTNSTLYTTPFQVGSSYGVRARAVKSGMTDSPIGTFVYGCSYGGSTTVKDGLDNSGIIVVSNNGWVLDYNDYYSSGPPYYYDSVRSPDVSAGESSSLEIGLIGPGTVTFYTKVYSEPNVGYLTFSIDSIAQESLTGYGSDWTQKTYHLTSGSHVLKWTYSAGTSTWYSDRGAVDYLQFTPASGQASAPSISPNGGTYSSSTSVTLSTSTSGASIHYSLTGENPTLQSPVYSSAITVNKSSTLKAMAFKTGMAESSVTSAAFTINHSFSSTDTDSDGLSDAWEQHFFGNLNQIGHSDWDGDGISNIQEFQNSSNPVYGIGLQVFTGLK